MPATPVWLAAAEALLNRGIESSAQAVALLERLEKTSIRVDIEGITVIQAGIVARRLTLSIIARRPADTTPGGPDTAPADATITGSPAALWALSRTGSARSAPGAAAQISGDAEIANAYRQLFMAARPDLEEELSRLVGDFPARRLSQFAARALSWATHARRTAGSNLAEYLQEESRDLVSKPELDEFLQGVDALREAADRIDARLARLERRLPGAL